MPFFLLSSNRWLELYQARQESGLSKARIYHERMPDLCSNRDKYPSVYTLYDRLSKIERTNLQAKQHSIFPNPILYLRHEFMRLKTSSFAYTTTEAVAAK